MTALLNFPPDTMMQRALVCLRERGAANLASSVSELIGLIESKYGVTYGRHQMFPAMHRLEAHDAIRRMRVEGEDYFLASEHAGRAFVQEPFALSPDVGDLYRYVGLGIQAPATIPRQGPAGGERWFVDGVDPKDDPDYDPALDGLFEDEDDDDFDDSRIPEIDLGDDE